MVVDKNQNRYLLASSARNSYLLKFNEKNILIWKKTLSFNMVNLLINSKGDIYLTSFYIKDLDLEINSKKIEIKSNNTKSMLILKFNSGNGELLNYLNISTNYGVTPVVSRLDEKDNLYIGGNYGGNSEFFEKTAYNSVFLLVLDDNLKKMWSKSFINNTYTSLHDFKIGKNKIYLTLIVNNINQMFFLDRVTKKEEMIDLKEKYIVFFDIDKDENIYLINNQNFLKKFDNKFVKLKEIKLSIGDHVSVTPIGLNLKKDSLFIEYASTIEYRKNIIIAKYNLNFDNHWYYAILGENYLNNNLRFFNDKFYLFGEYTGNLFISDDVDCFGQYVNHYLIELED
jgi:hypothetical protein